MTTGISPSYPDTTMFLGLQLTIGSRPPVRHGQTSEGPWVFGRWARHIGHIVSCEPLINGAWRAQQVSLLRTSYLDYIAVIYIQHVCLYMQARPPRPPEH